MNLPSKADFITQHFWFQHLLLTLLLKPSGVTKTAALSDVVLTFNGSSLANMRNGLFQIVGFFTLKFCACSGTTTVTETGHRRSEQSMALSNPGDKLFLSCSGAREIIGQNR